MSNEKFIPVRLQLTTDAKQFQSAFALMNTSSSQLQKTSKTSFDRIENDGKKAAKSTETAWRNFALNAGKSFLDRLAPDAARSFKNIREDANRTGTSITKALSQSVGGASGLLGTITGGAGGFLLSGVTSAIGAVAGGMASVIQQGIGFQRTIEGAKISLTAFLGDSKLANDEIEKLKKAALDAPVKFTTLLDAERSLVANKFDFKDLAKDLTDFSQALLLKAGPEQLDARLERIVLQLGQMKTKGKAANEELVILAENNVPVYELLSKAFGKSEAEIFKLAESGQLKGKETAQVIIKEFAKIGQTVGPELKNSISVLESNLEDLTEQAAGKATQNLVTKFYKPALQSLTGEKAQGIVGNVAGRVDSVVGVLGDKGNDIVNAISSGNFLTKGKEIAQGLTDGIKSGASSAWEATKNLGSGVLTTLEDVLDMHSPSREMYKRGVYAGDGFIQGLVDRTSDGFKKWRAQIEKDGGDEFIKAIEAMAARLKADPNQILNVMAFESRLNPGQKNLAGGGASGLIQFMPDTAKALGTTTAQLRSMNAIEQLKYVEKYFKQFGEVLKTQEAVYTSVLAGSPTNDPNKTLFRNAPGKAGRNYRANSGVDLNKDGLVTAGEAASLTVKQGFTSNTIKGRTPKAPTAAIQLGNAEAWALYYPGEPNPYLKPATTQSKPIARSAKKSGQDNSFLDSYSDADLAKAGLVREAAGSASLLVKESSQIKTNFQLIPTAAAQLNLELDQNTKVMRGLVMPAKEIATATNSASDAAKTFAEAWRNPLEDKLIAVKNELELVGKFMDKKAELAQMEAILELRKADEDATLSMIRNRIRLGDATVYHSNQSNAIVLDNLTRQTKSITEIGAEFKINLLDQGFDLLDKGIDKVTGKFKALNSLIKDLARLAVTTVLQKLFNPSGQGSTQQSSGGGFNIGSLLGGGGNSGGGFNLGSLLGAPGGTSGFAGPLGGGQGGGGLGLLNKIPFVNKLFSGSGILSKVGGLFGLGGGAAASGVATAGTAAGATGAFAGATASAGAAGGAGLLTTIGALASNPFTIAAAAAIGGGFLLYKLLHGRDLKKLRNTIKGEYSVDVKDNNILKEVKGIGVGQFGKDWKNKMVETVRLDPSKQIIQNYAEATNQGTGKLLLEKRKLDPNDQINRYTTAIERREFGGPVVAGVPYIVGERRPELFIPSQNGTIAPSVPRAVGQQQQQVIPVGLFQAILAEIAALRAQMQPVNGDEFFMAKLQRNSEQVAQAAYSGQRGSGQALGTLANAGF